METFKKEAKKVGNSLGVIIPTTIVKSMGIYSGKILKVCIKFADDNMISFCCRDCNHKFSSSDINPFCPKCRSELLEEISW